MACTISENEGMNIILLQYVITFSPLISFKMLYFLFLTILCA